jgi:hypothetical protein
MMKGKIIFSDVKEVSKMSFWSAVMRLAASSSYGTDKKLKKQFA